MNKILILEPFYTNFHIDLAHSLSEEVYSFVFNFGNLIYLKGSQKSIVHNKILKSQYSPEDLVLAQKTKSLYTETLRKSLDKDPSKSDFEYMAKYISYLRAFIIEKRVNLLLMHNDLRWQHALAIQVCNELGIRYLVTERGIFRPDTTTVDLTGVNAYCCIPKEPEFYQQLNIFIKPLKSYKLTKVDHLFVNLKFIGFIALNKIGDVLGINSSLSNKSYRFKNYITLFLKQYIFPKRKIRQSVPKGFIFIPLQVNTDTQILVHSEYTNMQAFISQVESTFYAQKSNLKLVFKEHPMQKGNYRFDNRSLVIDTDTEVLIRESEFVITINSTVGFEAIQKYKKVIVLGNAFYKIKGIVICSSVDSFKDDLLNCLNDNFSLDKELIIKFVAYLSNEYQINGSLFNYDKNTLNEIKNCLQKK